MKKKKYLGRKIFAIVMIFFNGDVISVNGFDVENKKYTLIVFKKQLTKIVKLIIFKAS